MGLQSPMAAGQGPLPKSGTIVGCFSSLFKSRVKGRGQPAGWRPPFHRSRILWGIYSDRGAIRYSSRERSPVLISARGAMPGIRGGGAIQLQGLRLDAYPNQVEQALVIGPHRLVQVK